MIDILGHTLELDTGDSFHLADEGSHEPFITRFLPKWIEPGDTVIDVGAHIGYHTLLMARAVGEQGKVVAFEPHPDNFQLLERNVSLNDYDHVTLHQTALGAESGKSQLYLCDYDSGGHRLTGDNECADWETMGVRVDPLDSYAVAKEADLIKVDVEGREHLVISGLRKTIELGQPLKLLIEFWPTTIRRNGGDPVAMLEYLGQQGFEMKFLPDMVNGPLEPAGIDDLMQYEVTGGWIYILLVRE